MIRDTGKDLAHCPHIYLERKQFANSLLSSTSSIDGKHSKIDRLGKLSTLGKSATGTTAVHNRSLESTQGAGNSFNVSGDKAQKLSTKGSSSFESGLSSGKLMKGAGVEDAGLELCLRVNGTI